MDDIRKETLRKLNPKFIQSNGTYIVRDKEGTIVRMTKLMPEDIKYLRWYHQNQHIASDVVIPTKRPSANVNTGSPRIKGVSIDKSQKYNKPKYRLKESIRKFGTNVVIFGMVVCIGVGAFTIFLSDKEQVQTPSGAYVTMTDAPGYTSGTNYMDSPTIPEEELDEDYVKQVERAEFIKILAQIYQVDYQETYSKLVELTDNFSSGEFLEGKHPLVTCKGMQIDADSEEEFLVYAVRVIAQAPSRVGLTEDEVCIDNGYDSGTDYVAMIAKWSEVLNVDPALVYGIVQAETGWSSDLFVNGNNPGGLKDVKDGSGDGFWIFKNKEAGLLELMMEIVKYQYKGAITIEQMAQIHCPVDDPNDTEGLNRNWVKNVTNGYREGREIFEQMGFYKNNGLSY